PPAGPAARRGAWSRRARRRGGRAPPAARGSPRRSPLDGSTSRGRGLTASVVGHAPTDISRERFDQPGELGRDDALRGPARREGPEGLELLGGRRRLV